MILGSQPRHGRHPKSPIAEALRIHFPHFPLPVARLERLVVDNHHQQQGLGELLLADALYRYHRLASEIGMIGVIVDARHEQAKASPAFEFESPSWLPAKLCGSSLGELFA